MPYLFAGQYGPAALLDTNGLPQPNLTVTVYLADGITKATLWTDRTKATTAANPTVTDTYGNLVFYADPAETT